MIFLGLVDIFEEFHHSNNISFDIEKGLDIDHYRKHNYNTWITSHRPILDFKVNRKVIKNSKASVFPFNI